MASHVFHDVLIAAPLKTNLPWITLPKHLAHALTQLGSLFKNNDQGRRALPLLLEALTLLKRNIAPSDPTRLTSLTTASMAASDTLKVCNRHDEAARILEEAMEECRAARAPRGYYVLLSLAKAYLEMGRFEAALEVGRQAEELMDAPTSGGGGVAAHGRSAVDPSVRVALYAAMATAIEGLGRLQDCTEYDTMALDISAVSIGMFSPDTMSCFCRQARLLYEMGKAVEAEEMYQKPLRHYVQFIKEPGSQGLHSSVRLFVPELRSLVQIKRQLGKEEEARALEQDLDETEAIIRSTSAAALDEVRAELRAEAAATAGVGATGPVGRGSSDSSSRASNRRRRRRSRRASSRSARRRSGASRPRCRRPRRRWSERVGWRR